MYVGGGRTDDVGGVSGVAEMCGSSQDKRRTKEINTSRGGGGAGQLYRIVH